MQRLLFYALILVLGNVSCLAQEVTRELKKEADGFEWCRTSDYTHNGAETPSGKTIIPMSKKYVSVQYRSPYLIGLYYSDKPGVIYKTEYYTKEGKEILDNSKYDDTCLLGGKDGAPFWFLTKKDGKEGACDINGKEIVPPIYEACFYSSGELTIQDSSGYHAWSEYNSSGSGSGSGSGSAGGSGNTLASNSGSGNSANTLASNTSGSGSNANANSGSGSGSNSSGTYNSGSGSSSNYNSNSSSSSTTTGGSAGTTAEDVKAMFDLAYNTSDSDAQTKYNRYMEVVRADPYNRYGYKAPAYNNVGVLYESLGDLGRAKNYYELALQVNPSYAMAKQNLKNVKAQRRSQRWANIGNALGAVNEALNTINSAQSGGTYNNTSSYSGSTNTGNYSGYSSGSGSGYSSGGGSGSSSGSTTCNRCNGSGKCSSLSVTADKYYCHGSGRCGYCSGNGTLRNLGQTIVCTACNGNGKCKYCNASGKCSSCHGTGKK